MKRRQPKCNHVHVFDYSNYSGFTEEQIRKFLTAKKKKQKTVPKRKKTK